MVTNLTLVRHKATGGERIVRIVLASLRFSNAYIKRREGGALNVMVIVVENGISESSSNLGLGRLRFTLR